MLSRFGTIVQKQCIDNHHASIENGFKEQKANQSKPAPSKRLLGRWIVVLVCTILLIVIYASLTDTAVELVQQCMAFPVNLSGGGSYNSVDLYERDHDLLW